MAIEIERYYGSIVKAGESTVKCVLLPDWDINYIEFPLGEMPNYRDALMRERVKIRKVTDIRIYFEQ